MSSPTSNSSKILGLAEVVLNVDDLQRAKQFYQDVLGFRLVKESSLEDPPSPDGAPTISFLEVQPTDSPLGHHGHPLLLALIDYRRHAPAKVRFTALKIEHSPLNHMAFEISPDDYDHHFARLTELGRDPYPVEFPNMQAKAMFFNDPEGNTLELICHQPA